jgi:hypothetical protein
MQIINANKTHLHCRQSANRSAGVLSKTLSLEGPAILVRVATLDRTEDIFINFPTL